MATEIVLCGHLNCFGWPLRLFWIDADMCLHFVACWGEIIFNDRLISLFFQIISKCRKAGSFGIYCLWVQLNMSITFAVQKSVYLLVLTYV